MQQTRQKQMPQGAQDASLLVDGNYINDVMSPKKTALIIVTVIGCIAILWPSVFYPMLFASPPSQKTTTTNLKEQQQHFDGCCDVVLDSETFVNASILRSSVQFGPQIYRKHMDTFIDEISLPQERPVKFKQNGIYEAMRERGRAIPATQSVPIVERKVSSSKPAPRIIDGRPGPIPGLRPPMGGGAMQQPQQKAGSVGILMPIYTIGIIVFFVYTIMKLVGRKPIPNAPYGPAPLDPKFRKEVFGHEHGAQHIEELKDGKVGAQTQTRDDNELYNASLLASNVATQLSTAYGKQRQQSGLNECQQQVFYNKEVEQQMEIEKLRKKLHNIEREMAKLINEMNSDQFNAKKLAEAAIAKCLDSENSTSGHAEQQEKQSNSNSNDKQFEEHPKPKETKIEHSNEMPEMQLRKRRDISAEREMMVLGMEVTACYEGGRKWTGRPITPELICYSEHHKATDDIGTPEPQSIYLKGTVAHESQILVADTETKREEVYDPELNGSPDEPAVIISSKMTLSLINLDNVNHHHHHSNAIDAPKNDIESPLADDIEIIGHDER